MKGEGSCSSEARMQFWKCNLDFTELPNLKLFADLSLLCVHASACLGLRISSTGSAANPGQGCAGGRAVPLLLTCSTLPLLLLVALASKSRTPGHVITQILGVQFLPSGPQLSHK